MQSWFWLKGYTDAAKLACSSLQKCYILRQEMFLIRNQFYLFICLFFWYTLRRTVMGRGLLASTFMLQELHNFIAFRNKIFLFVKIESWNFQNLHDSEFCWTSQNFIYLSWQTKDVVKKVLPITINLQWPPPTLGDGERQTP